MAEGISRISPDLLAQIMGTESADPVQTSQPVQSEPRIATDNITFDNVLQKAVDSLEGVSKTEVQADKMMEKYIRGQADASEVMIATAKMNIAVQLAVTVVTSAVNTFKEITQMQV